MAYALVHLETRTASVEEPPDVLRGLAPDSLVDLGWTDNALGLHGFGYWPVEEAAPVPAPGEGLREGRLEADDARHVVVRHWTAEPLSEAELSAVLERSRADRFSHIDAERDARIAAGMPYAFPDGEGTVQLRNERDITNVIGVGTSGMMLAAAGDAETTVGFRDREDVTHPLTGAQAQALGQAVMAWISAHYSAAWAHKDAVGKLLKVADMNALLSYDVSAGWPRSAASTE